MLNRTLCLLLTPCCLLIFSSCENSCPKQSDITKIYNAQNIFEENCIACHGSDGKLCAMGAKDLSASNMNITQTMEIITNGKSTMTPFGNMLSKAEIDSVALYVQTLRK